MVGALTKWQLEELNLNSLLLSDFRTWLEVICQPNVCVCVLWCAVDRLWLWTEASLSLKGNCCLVRRKPERTQAGRQAKIKRLECCIKQKKKPKRKKKKPIPRRRKSNKKKNWEFFKTTSGLERLRLKSTLFSVSWLEVSVAAVEAAEPKPQPQWDPWKPLWSFSVTSCDSDKGFSNWEQPLRFNACSGTLDLQVKDKFF